MPSKELKPVKPAAEVAPDFIHDQLRMARDRIAEIHAAAEAVPDKIIATNKQPEKPPKSIKTEARPTKWQPEVIKQAPVVEVASKPVLASRVTESPVSEAIVAARIEVTIALAEAVDEVFGEERVVLDNEELGEFLASADEVEGDIYSEAEYRELEGFGAEDDDVEPGEQYEMAASDDADELAVNETLGGEEVIYDAGVMDTFEQLVALISAEQDETPAAATPELFEGMIEGQVVALRADTSELSDTVETNPFAEYVAAQPVPEEPTTIEVIIAQAGEQPLEETLTQLAFYLAETAAEPAEEDQAAPQLLKEIEDILLQLNIAESNPDQPEQPVLTPEVTQKLLLLLRAVGYQDPKTVLLEFVEQHSLDYLLQATRHLYQLTDDYKQQEFLALKQAFPTIDDAPFTTRLGKIIFRLIGARPTFPELVAA